MDKQKILYVDDDPMYICLMCRIMRDSKFEIIPACSAKDAIAILKDTPELKVIISDWIMPEMDGLELVQYIKDVYPDKICYMISSSTEIDRLKPFEEKRIIQKYFQKPVDKTLLINEIESICDSIVFN